MLAWIVQCFTSPPTQYRLYGRRFLQVKRPNQQYQSTEGDATKESKERKQLNHKYGHTIIDTPAGGYHLRRLVQTLYYEYCSDE